MNYKIVSKYIKDISFEIPDAKSFVMLEKEISNYNLNFDIKSKPFKDNIIEVNTILKLLPGNEVKDKMLSEINLTALVTIDTYIKGSTIILSKIKKSDDMVENISPIKKDSINT